jgi:hypothetical protein
MENIKHILVHAGLAGAVITICVCVLLGCTKPPTDELVLLDFENDEELEQLFWKCFTLYSISGEHATHGRKSLKLELFPSSWPGVTPKLSVHDWRGFKAFGFDVYNPGESEIKINVRIDDRDDFPDYGNRYNHSFFLKPGLTRVEIPVEALITSGTQRILDLKRIYSVAIFLGHPKQKYILYLDAVRLMKAADS